MNTPEDKLDAAREKHANAAVALCASNMRARLGYRAAVAYLEDVLARMEQLGVKKSDLAVRLNLKRQAVSRLFEPGRNLTMFTAAMIAEALDARLEVTLSPKGAHLPMANGTRSRDGGRRG
jgi:hypothetical protein